MRLFSLPSDVKPLTSCLGVAALLMNLIFRVWFDEVVDRSGFCLLALDHCRILFLFSAHLCDVRIQSSDLKLKGNLVLLCYWNWLHSLIWKQQLDRDRDRLLELDHGLRLFEAVVELVWDSIDTPGSNGNNHLVRFIHYNHKALELRLHEELN